jgi:hypothetical protein
MQRLPQAQLNAEAAAVATPAQLAQIAKLSSMGWVIHTVSGQTGIAGRLRANVCTIRFSSVHGAFVDLDPAGNVARIK